MILTLEEGAGAAKAEEKKPRLAAKPEEEMRGSGCHPEEVKAVAAPSRAPRAETRAKPRAEEPKRESKKEAAPRREEKAEEEEPRETKSSSLARSSAQA